MSVVIAITSSIGLFVLVFLSVKNWFEIFLEKIDLEQRIYKAIEYIETKSSDVGYALGQNNTRELLKILKGEDK